MQHPKKAIVVNVIPPEVDKREAEKEFDELIRLVETYGGIVILKVLQKRGRPSAKTFLGEGKAQEVAGLVKELKADIVIVNDFLKSNQSNHLVNIIPCEVLDRFELILLIFEKHAQSPEAKLQIELMRARYEFPKLFGMGAALAQQKGGISVSRGPGEKMLEVKKRHLKGRIQTLERQLEQFVKVRREQRLRRKRQNFFSVAIVGYTNSGKSTLLKTLTRKDVRIENKLFSTLDTRLGEMYVPENGVTSPRILISDTIGFIQNLPPLLFNTFLATLEEAKSADLILHVIDAADPKMFEKIKVVEHVLHELSIDYTPKIFVFNKIDLVNDDKFIHKLSEMYSKFNPVFLSAEKKINMEVLKTKIADIAATPLASIV